MKQFEDIIHRFELTEECSLLADVGVRYGRWKWDNPKRMIAIFAFVMRLVFLLEFRKNKNSSLSSIISTNSRSFMLFDPVPI